MDSIRLNAISLIILYWCSLGGGTALNRTVRQASCSRAEFPCARGGCIRRSDVCNGWNQCADGSDESPIACECGKGAAIGQLTNLPAGSYEAPPGSHPWHVGVYRVRVNNHHTLICSGVLIYDDVVLTTANCVIDLDSHLPYAPSFIRIGVGKLKRDYNIEETFQQRIEVRKIVQMERYEGDIKGYAKNLAIIKMKKKIRKSDFVSPACLWTFKTFPSGSKIASIAGWGLQLKGNYAINLRQSRVDMMDIDKCVPRLSDALYKRFLTNDKFCFFFDKGVGLKEDDIGGAVVIVHEGRAFVVGVLSVQVPNADFGIATKIVKHLDWIKKKTFELKEADNCLQGSHFNCKSNNKCINMDQVCDDKKDCEDGSDEDQSICRDSKPDIGDIALARCHIPEANEIFTLVCEDPRGCKDSVGWASSPSKYKITCPKGRGFATVGLEAKPVACIDGEWIPPLSEAKCLKFCSLSPLDFKSLQVECEYRGETVRCNEEMRPETVVKLSCKRHFKKQLLVKYAERTRCRSDGSFEHDISAECTPVCGVPFDNEAQVLISSGKKTKYAKYPWHAGLYWKAANDDGDFDYTYQCGGTLIDTNKVLTAGHCIWESGRNTMIDAANLAVALGKYYSRWSIPEDLEEKTSVYKIIPGKHYDGARTKHSQDIAVIILSRTIDISNYIMPACLDLKATAGGIPPKQKGHIVGWGRLKENDPNPSLELMETWMEYIDLETCRKKYQRYDFHEYLQRDKFCVKYENGSGTQMGDSGGGFTFIHDHLHYVYGVVSIKKRNQDEFAAFTNVLEHSAWLEEIMKQY